MLLLKRLLLFGILTIGLTPLFVAHCTAQQLEFVVETGHAGTIDSIVFSPDGKLLASCDGTSIKLWDVETGQEIKSVAVFEEVNSLAFSRNGKRLAAGSYNNTIKIWDIEIGKELLTLIGHTNSISSVVFSPDDKMLASGSDDGTIRFWDSETGRPLKIFQNDFAISEIAFSPDGRRLASGDYGGEVKLWNVADAQEQKPLSFKGDSRLVITVAFSRDGQILASGGTDKTVMLWNLASNEYTQLTESAGPIVSLSFAKGGKTLAWGSGKIIRLWDVEFNREFRTLSENNDWVTPVVFSPDGKTLASGHSDSKIKLWDSVSGKVLKIFAANVSSITQPSFSPNGKKIVAGSDDKTTKLWNLESGEVKIFKDQDSRSIESVTFSPDSKIIASGSLGGAILLNLSPAADDVAKNAKPDGSDITLWDVASGKKLTTLAGHAFGVYALAFSADGKMLASGGGDRIIKIWDITSGQVLKSFQGHTDSVRFVAFSLDEKTLVSGSNDRTVKLWDVASGKQLRSFGYEFFETKDSAAFLEIVALVPNFAEEIKGTVMSPDKKFEIRREDDARLNLLNTQTGKLLVSLVALNGNDWVAIDPEGRFDASEAALKLIHYAYGLEIINLEQFKDEYYEPGLLQKIFKDESLRAVVPLKDAKLPPEIVSQAIEANSAKLLIKLKNRNGGFGAIRVFVNDKLAVADARDEKLKANPDTTEEFVNLIVDLKDSAFVRGKICEDKNRPETCRDNKVTVYTSNYLTAYQTSNITSRGKEIIWVGGSNALNDFKLPTLYAIVGGVSDYKGDTLRLKFAAKDAEDFSSALQLGAQHLFCSKDKPNCLDKVNITTLSTSGNPGTILPTKENFRKAFSKVAANAQPEDIVLVYLSGHGVSFDNTDTYFYLTQNATSNDKSHLTKNYLSVSITSKELLCWLTTSTCPEKEQQLEFEGKPQLGTKSLRQVIILDTCAAGKAGQTLALIAQKSLSTDQRRVIEFLKDKSGIHILMSSTADQPSYEANKFGQGLLTRALLEGMSGASLEEVYGFVDVQTLFRYAENRVEKLAVGFGGIQRPKNAVPSGKTFVIGQMMPSAQKQISDKLPKEKPYVLRPSFGSREDNFDHLDLNNSLAKLLNDQNNPLLTKGGDGILVYLNEDFYAGALKPTGFYTIQNGIVTVRVSLYRDGQRISEPFEVTGNKEEIAEKLLAAIRDKL